MLITVSYWFIFSVMDFEVRDLALARQMLYHFPKSVPFLQTTIFVYRGI
jgi:hypothetical protein